MLISIAVVALEATLLGALELARPLRARQEPKFERDRRNAVLAALALATTSLCEMPVAQRLSQLVLRRRVGLVGRLPLPDWARTLAAVAALDYTMYLWHALAHRWPPLWRFHTVHHVDRGLDASTALRFHAGEQVLSVPWRVAQIVVIGVTPRALAIWQTAFIASILFHHSDVRLGRRAERWTSRICMTPALHGIHHADRRDFQRMNLSSGLTIWDRLHGTYSEGVEQRDLRMGLPAYRDDADVDLGAMIALPFVAQSDAYVERPS